jgi:hypothetical protein
LVNKVAEGFQGDEFAGMRDGNRRGRKGMLGDGFPQCREGGGENLILTVAIL